MMNGSEEQCLVLACDGLEAAGELDSFLRQRGLGVTFSATEPACLELLEQHHWRLLIVDATGDHEGALPVLTYCTEAYPELLRFALIRRGNIRAAVRAIKAGAADCIEKPIDTTRLSAVMAVLDETPDEDLHHTEPNLTKTERLILHHILEGRTNSQIAQILCRSPRTIEIHRRHIMRKMDARHVVDLVRHALHMGQWS